MSERPIEKHQVAVKRLMSVATEYANVHIDFIRKSSKYTDIHYRFIEKIMAASDAYNWLKDDIVEHQEAHTELASEIAAHEKALEEFMDELMKYLDTHGERLEAEALDLLARAQKDIREGRR